MSTINYHRIVDWNNSIHGLDKHTSFEAGFFMSEEKALFLQGRIVDSNGVEVFRSSDLRELVLERYQSWNPTTDLEDFINAIALETVQSEPVYFQTPTLDMTIEVYGPVGSPDVFATTITMTQKFIILGSYEWRDSSHINIRMLCKKEGLLAFGKGLQRDLSTLLALRN
jgi:hypothetical protein